MWEFIPDKFLKVISAMCDNFMCIAAVKAGNEVSSWFHIKSKVKQVYVLSQFIWIISMYFVLKSTSKVM